MRKYAPSALLFSLILSVVAHPVEAGSLDAVTDQHLAQLEEMHDRAANFLMANDFDSAQRAYTDILLMEPDDETSYVNLGGIYLIRGEMNKARDSFENALNIDPYNEVAIAGIKKIMDPDGNREITDRIEKAVKLPPPPQEPAIVRPALPVISRTRTGKLYLQRLQMGLKIAGAYRGPVDGFFHEELKASIRNFQKDHGLIVSGTVTPATWNSLSLYLDTQAERVVLT